MKIINSMHIPKLENPWHFIPLSWNLDSLFLYLENHGQSIPLMCLYRQYETWRCVNLAFNAFMSVILIYLSTLYNIQSPLVFVHFLLIFIALFVKSAQKNDDKKLWIVLYKPGTFACLAPLAAWIAKDWWQIPTIDGSVMSSPRVIKDDQWAG